jgi:hypothetical protein
MISALIPGGVLVRVLVAALVIGAAYAAGQIHGRGAVHEDWREEQAKTALEATRIITRQGEVTVQVVTRWKERKAEIQTVTQTIEKEVIRYVPESHDPVLPVGWRMLHDAAAVGSIPKAPDGVDVTARDVKASAAARAVVSNYGTCHENALQLMALQDWIRHMYETTNLEPLR